MDKSYKLPAAIGAAVLIAGLGVFAGGLPGAHAAPGDTTVLPEPPVPLPTSQLPRITPPKDLPLTISPPPVITTLTRLPGGSTIRTPISSALSGTPGPSRTTISTPIPPEQAVPMFMVKKDRITGARLVGATFDVVPCKGSKPVQSMTIPAAGVTVSLLPGCYKAIETKVPAGYRVDAVEWYFDVIAGKPYTISFTNTALNYTPPPRDPDNRVPLQDIPSGPVVRN